MYFRMGNSIIDKNEKLLKYKENIDRFNNCVEEYQKVKSLNEEIFSNHEINRNNLLKDIIIKLISNEASSFKHLILDLEKILKVCIKK
jgi:protein subunit release factor A